MTKEVLLINPSFAVGEEYNFKIADVGTESVPPLGIAYIAAVLEKNGIRVGIIDALAEKLTLEELQKRIDRYKPSIVGVTSTTPEIANAIGTIKKVKESSDYVHTVLGGPHITSVPIDTLKSCHQIDYGVIGEGEYTALELFGKLLAGASVSDVRGIVYRGKDGEIVLTEKRPLIDNIDEIPFPARHLLPMHLYNSSPLNYRKQPDTSVICSRGCPYQCIFCTKTIFGTRLRIRSPESIHEELKMLKKQCGIKEIHFYDDTFTMKPEWTAKVCELMEDLDLIFWCNGRVNTVTDDLLAQMKKAGCYRIYYGVESGNDKSLKLLKKQTDTELIKKAFRKTQKHGIEAVAFMMLGVPGEDWADMMTSINFAKEIKADHAVFTALTPYPGTEVYRDVEKYGLLRVTDWSKYVMISDKPPFLAHSITEEELKKALSKAYRDFAFRPRYIRNKLRDIYYCPKKVLPYAKGAFSLLRG